MKHNKLKQLVKPFGLAVILATSSLQLLAADMQQDTEMMTTNTEANVTTMAPEIYDNESWQSPLVIEFTKLDTTGNGLLLPYEASKGKAFNKKTFAEADTDHDGTIDQNEYVSYKTQKIQ